MDTRIHVELSELFESLVFGSTHTSGHSKVFGSAAAGPTLFRTLRSRGPRPSPIIIIVIGTLTTMGEPSG